MSNSWRVISLVVLIAILFGALCVGVGLITGGEWDRIYSSLDAHYQIDRFFNPDPDKGWIANIFRTLKEAMLAPPDTAAPADLPADSPVPADTPEAADTSDSADASIVFATSAPADAPVPEPSPAPADTPEAAPAA